MSKTATLSRRQERTEITRARLIQSAEKVFARDGFEAAKLEEIAADAGYTRGAFYANFDSKEDLFFALLEREVETRIGALEREFKLLAVRHPEVRQRLAAMHRRFVGPRVGFLEGVMKKVGRELPVSAYAAGVSM